MIWSAKLTTEAGSSRCVIALSKLDQLKVDLIDMSKWAGSNNSRRYVVSIIDCFSKYAWLLPITQKKTEKVLEVLRPFLKEHTPKVSQATLLSYQCFYLPLILGPFLGLRPGPIKAQVM